MKVRYVGEDAETTTFGMTFARDKWVEVNAVPEAIKANPQFEVKVSGAAAPETTDTPSKYDGLTVAQLKAQAAGRSIDLGDAAKKADIVALLAAADGPTETVSED